MHHLSLSPAKASHAIASRPTLPLPQCNTYHDPKARYYTGEKQKKKKGCLVSWNGANRSSDWWIIGTKQCFQNVAITEVALNSKTFRERQHPRSAAIRKCEYWLSVAISNSDPLQWYTASCHQISGHNVISLHFHDGSSSRSKPTMENFKVP